MLDEEVSLFLQVAYDLAGAALSDADLVGNLRHTGLLVKEHIHKTKSMGG
jgi:hypothetical protein